jgi:hypothetical protein
MAQAFDWVAGRAPALQEIFELDENGNIVSSSVPLGDNVFSPAPVPTEEPVPVEEPAPVVEALVEEDMIEPSDTHIPSILDDSPAV